MFDFKRQPTKQAVNAMPCESHICQFAMCKLHQTYPDNLIITLFSDANQLLPLLPYVFCLVHANIISIDEECSVARKIYLLSGLGDSTIQAITVK